MGKRTYHHYIGLVTKKLNNEFLIKFMKKSTNDKFVLPEEDDVSVIECNDILTVLEQPTVNNRQQYLFNLRKCVVTLD